MSRPPNAPKIERKTLSPLTPILKPCFKACPLKLVAYVRVSSDSDLQGTDLQHDTLRAAGVEPCHLFKDHGSGARDERSGIAQALDFVRSLSHMLAIVNTLEDKGVAFRSHTEGMDTTTASSELLFHVFGALAQFERALIQERVVAGLAAARRRGRIGGRPPSIFGEKLDAIIAALDGGMSKAAVCRNFCVKRTTLIETLARVGWPAPTHPEA